MHYHSPKIIQKYETPKVIAGNSANDYLNVFNYLLFHPSEEQIEMNIVDLRLVFLILDDIFCPLQCRKTRLQKGKHILQIILFLRYK